MSESKTESSVTLPKYDGKKERFRFWWDKFSAYAVAKKFDKAIKLSSESDLPDSHDDAVDVSTDAGKKQSAAIQRNANAVAALTMAFTTPRLMRIKHRGCTREWPDGLASAMVAQLFKKYGVKADDWRHELSKALQKISMKDVDEDPVTLFEQVAEIQVQFNDPNSGREVDEEEMVSAVINAVPNVYVETVATERRLKGNQLTLDDLEDALDSKYRLARGNNKNDVDDKEMGLAGVGSSGVKCFTCGAMGHKSFQCPKGANGGAKKPPKFQGTCNNCGKIGHKAVDCWDKEENKGKRPNWYKQKGPEGNTGSAGAGETANIGLELSLCGLCAPTAEQAEENEQPKVIVPELKSCPSGCQVFEHAKKNCWVKVDRKKKRKQKGVKHVRFEDEERDSPISYAEAVRRGAKEISQKVGQKCGRPNVTHCDKLQHVTSEAKAGEIGRQNGTEYDKPCPSDEVVAECAMVKVVGSGIKSLLNPNVWIADTGASTHISASRLGMTNLRGTTGSTQITMANGSGENLGAVGDLPVIVCDKMGHMLAKAVMRDISLVPGAKFNLYSIPQMLARGWTLGGDKNVIWIKSPDGMVTLRFDIVIPTPKGAVYAVYLQRSYDVGGAAVQVSMDISTAHARVGHISEDMTRKIASSLGWKLKPGPLGPCEACTIGKAKQKNLPRNEEHARAGADASRIFLDVMTVKEPNDGNRRVIWRIMVDERLQLKFTDFYATKSGMIEPTLAKINKWKQNGYNIKYLRMDNAGENKKLAELAMSDKWKLNIEVEYTGRDTPQRNHLAEISLHSLASRARAMISHANIPEDKVFKLFPEAVKTATLMDGLVVIDVDGVSATRYEHWNKKQPPFAKYLRTWGEAGTVKTRTKMTPKIVDRGAVCIMVGYAENHAGDTYRMYNPATNGVMETRDIIWLRRMYYAKPDKPAEFLREPDIEPVDVDAEVNPDNAEVGEGNTPAIEVGEGANPEVENPVVHPELPTENLEAEAEEGEIS